MGDGGHAAQGQDMAACLRLFLSALIARCWIGLVSIWDVE